MNTWSTLIGPTFFTVSTLSGMCGCATSGSRVFRSISTISSYSASASALSSVKSPSRPWAFRNARVTSSLGNTLVVAPSSAPMFAIVARSGTVRVFTPSPMYSITLPTPPLTLSRRSTSRMMSFAATP